MLPEDIDMIRVHVSDLLFTDLAPEVFVGYFESIKMLVVQDDEANDELREILLSKLMTMRITDETSET